MPDFTNESSEVARRFRRQFEGYTSGSEGNFAVYRLTAISERAVDLFLRLSARLDPVVDVFIDHPRDATSWRGTMRFLPDVRESLGRLRWPLATYGGVEVTLVTPDDQLTLTTALEVVIFSRTTRWPQWLDAEGVGILSEHPPIVWRPDAVPHTPAPDLTEALEQVTEKLALESAS